MSEQQFKHWMSAKTRQYIWLILHTDPNHVKITFQKSFKRPFQHSHGTCRKDLQHIYYRTDYVVNGWDCDLGALERLVIHEVCHLEHIHHTGAFFTMYKKWSGDDFIERWITSDVEYTKPGKNDFTVERHGSYNMVFTPNVAGLPKI